MEDLCLLQASSGVTFRIENVGYLFNTRMLQLTASGQEHFGTPLLVKKTPHHINDSTIFLSHTPFCCGVYATVNCLLMPWSSQNSANVWELYSTPRPVRRTFIALLVSLQQVLYNF